MQQVLKNAVRLESPDVIHSEWDMNRLVPAGKRDTSLGQPQSLLKAKISIKTMGLTFDFPQFRLARQLTFEHEEDEVIKFSLKIFVAGVVMLQQKSESFWR